MPRHARTVFPGVPHHVTQRGNRRERVFFSRGDHAAYLGLLGEQAKQFIVDVVAYCLMPNHVHLVVIPSNLDGLHLMFKAVHGQYAQRVNRVRNQKGHIWQGRYFSSPLDAHYLLNAVRYVELNPVRAQMVVRAEDYAWSSAAAHCGLRNDPLVDSKPRLRLLAGIANWSHWLTEESAENAFETLRRHGGRNLPCGSSEFVAQLERSAGRTLRFRLQGREPTSKSTTI
ncbi:MAG: transposase [Steroidobacteraceae bacterium]